jgi:hypothetical protein
MTRLALIAALLAAASSLALAQSDPPKAQGGPATPRQGADPMTGAPVVGGSPSGATTATPQANGARTSGMGASRPSPAAVKEMLEREGYTTVTDVEETAEGFTATATKAGRTMRLKVDPGGAIAEHE